VCTNLLFSLDIAELRYPVDMSVVLAKLIPLLLCKEVFDIRIIIQIIIECYQNVCIIEL